MADAAAVPLLVACPSLRQLTDKYTAEKIPSPTVPLSQKTNLKLDKKKVRGMEKKIKQPESGPEPPEKPLKPDELTGQALPTQATHKEAANSGGPIATRHPADRPLPISPAHLAWQASAGRGGHFRAFFCWTRECNPHTDLLLNQTGRSQVGRAGLRWPLVCGMWEEAFRAP